MNYYLAPMEGITGYVYRNAYHRHFGRIGKYFTPFLSPHLNKAMTSRERNDVLPEHNRGILLVPQILTNDAEAFCSAMRGLWELGYREVNLNLGCPSGTVAAKGKGSGFLAAQLRERLECFLDEIFDCAENMGMRVSIKTRLGKESSEGFEELLELYLRFPLSELIIHPRVQTDFYKNTPHWEAFRLAKERACGVKLCYNGDIFTPEELSRFRAEFPETECVMLGRGVIANPGLAEWMETGKNPLDEKRFRDFHEDLLNDYREVMSGDRNTLFKMKELWTYMLTLFPDSEKEAKKIRKAGSMEAYLAAVEELLGKRMLCPERGFQGF